MLVVQGNLIDYHWSCSFQTVFISVKLRISWSLSMYLARTAKVVATTSMGLCL